MIYIYVCTFLTSALKSICGVGNSYVGQIDDNDFNLPNLIELSLSHNRFRGSLPTGLHNQTLDVFDVSNNRFKGGLDFVINPAYSNSTFSVRSSPFYS